jgi:hypothetical protein
MKYNAKNIFRQISEETNVFLLLLDLVKIIILYTYT